MGRERLRLGIVGCGAVFERYHRPALAGSPDWELAALCDVSPARRAWARRTSPGVPFFDSPTGILDRERLDAALVATPPDTHAGLGLEALGAGLHVLVEKPLATRLSDARLLVEAAEAGGTILAVGFNRRFRGGYPELRNALEGSRGGIAGIRHVFFAEERWQPEAGRAPASLAHLLHDIACHQADLVTWITGTTVHEARARPLAREGEAAVRICLRLEGGLVAECTAGYSRRYVERLEVDLPGERLVVRPAGLQRVHGPGWPGEVTDRIRQAADQAAGRLLGRPTRAIRSFERQLAAFAAAARGAPSACAGARDGLLAVAVVEACARSLDAGGGWESVCADRAAVGR